jgi:uncharacterized protein (DUF3820 family)
MALINIGKYKGRPLSEMKTSYIMWLVSNDHIRFARWPLVLDLLAELQQRFYNYDCLISELTMSEPANEFWKSPELDKRRQAEKVEKLKLLELRRISEKPAR